MPILALSAGAGVLACSIANALARTGNEPTQLLYWFGILLISVPIAYRLTGQEATGRERLALVALLGLALFGVKVVRDAPLFSFSDELVHAYNVQQIEVHHHLFTSNPIIPVTTRYPGLEGATSAVAMLAGLSPYAAGTIVVGVARVVFIVALFFLFARVSHSVRAAGLGVAVYTGTSNFLFWNAQFSYESLALPLLIVAVMALAEWEVASPRARRGWAAVIVLVSFAIVVTHHITSYALVAALVALAVICRLLKVDRPNPWPFALAAASMVGAWLLFAAGQTIGYLEPVIRDAIDSAVETASGGAPARTLFHSSASKIGETPLPARLVALAAVGLIAIAFLLGLREIWRHRGWRAPFPLFFTISGLAYFGALALRFAPAAWETGNRAGEFLFVGLAFVAGVGILQEVRPGARLARRRGSLALLIGVVLVGGAISGWPWDVQLSKPLQIQAEGEQTESEALALAHWATRHLPADEGLAAPQADARLLLEPGGRRALTGKSPNVEDVLSKPRLEPWALPLLRGNGVRYVVADRREVSYDTLRGYYFTVPKQVETSYLEPVTTHKFARAPFGRVWNSGHISVFDVENRP